MKQNAPEAGLLPSGFAIAELQRVLAGPSARDRHRQRQYERDVAELEAQTAAVAPRWPS